jgi:hypothetical protein
MPKIKNNDGLLWKTDRYFRFEKHTMEKYFYENAEFLADSEDEQKFGFDYVEILKKIELGKIDPNNLGPKM